MGKSKFKKILPYLIGVVVAAVLVGGGYAYAAMAVNKEGIFPGVTVEGKELGGKTAEEAENVINEAFIEENDTFKIKYLENEFEVAPGGLGFSYDSEKIAETAYNECRKGNVFKRFFEMVKIQKFGKEIDPVYLDDKEYFDEAIEMLISEFTEAAKPVSVQIEGNVATVTLNRNEKLPDYDKLFKTVKGMVESKMFENLEMPLTEHSEVNENLVYLAIYKEPKDAYSKKDEDGRVSIVAHENGIQVSKDAIKMAIANMKPNENFFKVEIAEVEPKVKTEDVEKGFFNDVLGTSVSHYASSTASRAHNVALAAKKINGVILNCGDEFSYNKTVGSRTTAAGFKTATIFTNGGISEEVGGGICQVSSTLYAAALYADLQIVERKNHTFTVAYSKPGLDATVYYGSIDFRFKNNTNNPIKIQAEGVNGVLTVNILGTNDKKHTVEITTSIIESYGINEVVRYNENLAPGTVKVVQSGQTGYKATGVKTVKDAKGNVVKTEKLPTSVYSSMNKIVEKGPEAAPVPEIPEVYTNPNVGGYVPEVQTPPQSSFQPIPQQPAAPAPETIPQGFPTSPVTEPAPVQPVIPAQ